VLGSAGGLGGAVDPGHTGADETALFGPAGCHGSASLLLRQGCDGVAHLFVGAAAADVAGEPLLDLLRGGVGVLVKHRSHGDDEARRAKVALLSGGGDKSCR